MVRPPRLKLALLAALVVLAHLFALEWLARQADAISGLTLMVPPMYTRLLKPVTPPPVQVVRAEPSPLPHPRVRAATPPRPPASGAQEREKARRAKAEKERQERLRAEQERAEQERAQAQAQQPAPPPPAEPTQEPQVAPAPTPAASEAVAAASAPALPASAPASAPVSATAWLDQWPSDTRLTYRVGGEWRGPMYGDAQVLWQREGGKYQVRLEVKVAIVTQVLTSQGEVTPDGLVPRDYEEMRSGGKRRWAQLGDEVVVLEKGNTVPRPPGVQDTASQFVELAQRFATGREQLAVGRTVSVWLARPGGVDQWTYDIVGREMLSTPRLGVVEAFHLKPRPLVNPRGNITAEMWFAPSLQYLPVKIKVMMGTEAHLDLLVEQIEQR